MAVKDKNHEASLKVSGNTITTTIIINASKASIWNALTNFDTYPEWNTLSVKVDGDCRQGAVIKAYSATGANLDLKITEIVPETSITWVDVSWFTKGGLMGGWRCRSIADNPYGPGVILTNHFEYTGILSFILKFMTKKFLIDGMTKENRGLQMYVASQQQLDLATVDVNNCQQVHAVTLPTTVRLFSALQKWWDHEKQESCENKKKANMRVTRNY